MATTVCDIEIVFDRFDELADKMGQRAGQVVRKTAFDIQADYQQNARRDTGAQVNSAYVVTANSSTYADAVQAAQQSHAEVELLPEVPQPDGSSAIVAVGAAYGAINEFGGETGPEGAQRRAGDGAMTQAAERQREPFLDAMQNLLE